LELILEDNTEVDDDDINEREDRTEETPAPSNRGKQLQNWPEKHTLAIYMTSKGEGH